MTGNNLIIQERKATKWKYLNIIDYLLPIYLFCTIPMLYIGWRYEFLFKGLTIITVLLYIFIVDIPRTHNTKLFNIFILLVLFSFVQYAYNNRPFSCYYNDASNTLTAMLFYYVGATDDRPGRTFYSRLVIALVIVFSLGLFFYVTTPSWYIGRNLEYINALSSVEYDEINVLQKMRFAAFFGDSYAVSHFSVFCSAIALFDLSYRQGRNRWFSIICLIIGLLSSVASMHRASIIGSFIAILTYMYFNIKTKHIRNNRFIIITALILLIGVSVIPSSVSERIGDVLGMVTERVDDNMSLKNALNERKFTTELLASQQFYIFGHGLGSGGGIVRAYGYPGVNDMQYVKSFFENGLVGVLLFIAIIFAVLRRGIKYIQYYLTEVIIILFILVAMLGSNSLSIYCFMVLPFWYAVGRICNNQYFNRLKNKEWI